MQRGAIFDETQTYRYLLWRQWDDRAPRVAFVMLNPSTADACTDDATIRRCIRFAQAWGYGALDVVNLFALVATHPQDLQRSPHPIGSQCDRYLLAAAQCDRLILAWGNGGTLHGRDRAALTVLASQRALEKAYCLGVTQIGQPRHPLYLRSDTALMPYRSPDRARDQAIAQTSVM